MHYCPCMNGGPLNGAHSEEVLCVAILEIVKKMFCALSLNQHILNYISCRAAKLNVLFVLDPLMINNLSGSK